ncbi:MULTISPECIES: hypothetical protein [Citrobacter]|uniref:hypothetical protein n=1 Tax=Citrobacter TaxID=544 RepID=UPI0006512E64|nr:MULTISPECIES: hypothetical protein [Citrobacter]KLV78304.1 hypothetical protein SK39_02999 [Citrobacter sp. BIDMC107]AYL53399.1 hypothetical protein CUC47_18655 [Citrobacter freundii]EJD6647876.1 hypothetical protein [Citrobacter freundii]EKV4488465.1 hypothetical protein [Citrobacter freundii]MBJ8695026.1 hypothetical protein [Citrobacter freundii]
MTSNSDFFDASELFNIPEEFDIPDAFFRADEFSKKSKVSLEDIISTWLDDKISLYVNLRSEYCRIIRYASKKEYRYDTYNIRTVEDFYQNEKEPQSSVRKFIPCDRSEINEHPNFSGSRFYKYIYNGYASGFWRLQPTSTTHLVTDNYNLKNANELWGETPGEVRVFGRDDKDYLNFNNDIYVSFERFYITNSGCQILRSLFSSNEENKIEKYDPPYNRIAMVLLINEMFSVNGHVTCSNVCTILSANEINVEQTTIKQVLEETSGKRDKPYKNNPKHSKIASCLITIYCKDNDITKTSSRVAQILNDFVRSSPKKWNIVFTTEMAVNLMKSK